MSINICKVVLLMIVIQLASTKPVTQEEDKIFKTIMDTPRKTTDSWNLCKAVLHSRYGFLLEILPNATVRGTGDHNSIYSKLELHSIGSGLLRIYGIHSRKYLSITDKGYLIGQDEPTLNTVFKELYLENHFQAFLSYKKWISKRNEHDPDWFVAIKKRGIAKRANETRKNQNSIKFIVKRNKNELLENN